MQCRDHDDVGLGLGTNTDLEVASTRVSWGDISSLSLMP